MKNFNQELLPTAQLSSHIECLWHQTLEGHLNCDNATLVQPSLMPPQGTFDIIFVPVAICLYQFTGNTFKSTKLTPGCWLLGQQTRSYYWQATTTTSIYGIRLKPFAFFATTLISPSELKDSVAALSLASHLTDCDIEQYLAHLDPVNINEGNCEKTLWPNVLERFAFQLFNDKMTYPEEVRAFSNVILLKKGDIRLNTLCQQFDVSKVTIRKKFLANIGILPKELCQIWRLNAFLLLTHEHPELSVTELGLVAGYYDQAHLTKEFKSIFPNSPTRLLKTGSSIVDTTFSHINKRFNGNYDPRCQ